MQIILGCQSQMVLKSTDCRVFHFNSFDSTALIYHKQKYLLRYHLTKQKCIKKCEWVTQKGRKIFDVGLVEKYYLVLCEDLRLYFLAMDLSIVCHHQFETKQYIFAIPSDNTKLLLIQTKSIAAFKITYQDKSVRLDYENQLSGSLDWNKACKRIQNYLLLYNAHEASLLDLLDMHHITKVKFQITLSDIYYSRDQLIVGDNIGTLIVFALDGSLQHYVERAHDGSIIQVFSNDQTIITVGNDISIRIWSFKNIITLLQCYPLNLQKIHNFQFISFNKFWIHSGNQLYLTDLNHILDTFHVHSSGISALSQNCIAFKNHVYYSLTQRTNLFVPSHTTRVLQIVDSPYEERAYFMHLQFQYLSKWVNDEPNHVYQYKDIRTINGDPLTQEISYIQFLTIRPPLFDAEVTFDQKDRLNFLRILGKPENQKFIALGGSRGALIFVSLNHFSLIYFRVNYNRESIMYLGQVDQTMIIVSQDLCINFVSTKPELLKSVKLNNLGPIQSIKDRLAIAIQNRLYVFNSNLVAYNTQSENETEILGLTSNLYHIASYSINQVKIWSLDGVPQISVQFHNSLDCVQLFNCEEIKFLVSLDGFLSEMKLPKPNNPKFEYPEITLEQLQQDFQASKPKTPLQVPQRNLSDLKVTFEPVQKPSIVKFLTAQKAAKEEESETKPSEVSKSLVLRRNRSVKKVSDDERDSRNDSSLNHENNRSFLLPAIPKPQERRDGMLEQFIQNRLKRGGPKNRRDWTMDRIILQNILKQMEQ